MPVLEAGQQCSAAGTSAPAGSYHGLVQSSLDGAAAALHFSAAKYPNIRSHALAAIAKGWPRVLVLNRLRADDRRDRLLEGMPTKAGFDRDEYPPAVGRGRPNGKQKGLVRGINPLGWMADVMYVPSSENRSHGSSMGAKLRRLCNGTRFRYDFTQQPLRGFRIAEDSAGAQLLDSPVGTASEYVTPNIGASAPTAARRSTGPTRACSSSSPRSGAPRPLPAAG
ncbi:MAG: hypothetical protein ACR2LK_01840 [Solirubrobacteraceae bacterium]